MIKPQPSFSASGAAIRKPLGEIRNASDVFLEVHAGFLRAAGSWSNPPVAGPAMGALVRATQRLNQDAMWGEDERVRAHSVAIGAMTA
jgi:hypothetical protein